MCARLVFSLDKIQENDPGLQIPIGPLITVRPRAPNLLPDLSPP